MVVIASGTYSINSNDYDDNNSDNKACDDNDNDDYHNEDNTENDFHSHSYN